MISPNRRYRVFFAVVLAAIVVPVAAQLASGCSDITLLSGAGPIANSTLPVVIIGAEPSTIPGVLSEGLSELSGQINGVNLQLTTSIPASGPYITVQFASTTSAATGTQIKEFNTDGSFKRSTISINTGLVNQAACNGLCFDPNAAGYKAAVKSTVQHEVLHTLRLNDSNMANLMGPFLGKNNVNNANSNLSCVIQRGKDLTTPATPPPTC